MTSLFLNPKTETILLNWDLFYVKADYYIYDLFVFNQSFIHIHYACGVLRMQYNFNIQKLKTKYLHAFSYFGSGCLT